MVNLAHLTFALATVRRDAMLREHRHGFALAVWEMLREYQRDVEAKLGVHQL